VDHWFHPTRVFEYWFFLVPVLLALALFVSSRIDRRGAAELESELVRLCQGSRSQAENLIAIEMGGRPGITRAIAVKSLIARLRRSSV
jgi:hypothetical protein